MPEDQGDVGLHLCALNAQEAEFSHSAALPTRVRGQRSPLHTKASACVCHAPLGHTSPDRREQ